MVALLGQSSALALLPLREKVARPKAETDEGAFSYSTAGA
jgi:hypothetical protein